MSGALVNHVVQKKQKVQSEQSPDVWADDKCLFSIQEVFLRSPEGQTRCMRSSKGGRGGFNYTEQQQQEGLTL